MPGLHEPDATSRIKTSRIKMESHHRRTPTPLLAGATGRAAAATRAALEFRKSHGSAHLYRRFLRYPPAHHAPATIPRDRWRHARASAADPRPDSSGSTPGCSLETRNRERVAADPPPAPTPVLRVTGNPIGAVDSRRHRRTASSSIPR